MPHRWDRPAVMLVKSAGRVCPVVLGGRLTVAAWERISIRAGRIDRDERVDRLVSAILSSRLRSRSRAQRLDLGGYERFTMPSRAGSVMMPGLAGRRPLFPRVTWMRAITVWIVAETHG